MGSGGLTFPGSNGEGGAHPQIMQISRRFDPKQAGLAANVSPVVKGRDSLGETPGEAWGFGGLISRAVRPPPSIIHYHIST